jgi:trimeric autotransporter adhesin
MKKLMHTTILFFITISFTSQAQNTFPSTGNAGIGTTAPQLALTINTTGFIDGILLTHTPNGYWTRLMGGSMGAGSYNGISQTNDAGLIYGGRNVDLASGFVIAPWANATNGMRFSSNGTVSLSTAASLDAFNMNHANGGWTKLFSGSLFAGAYNGISQNNDAGIIFGGAAVGNGPGFVLAPWANANSGLRVNNNGTVSVGGVTSTPAGYSLYVADGILSERVKVAIKTSANWADHVFEKGYQLPAMEKLEHFIAKNKHLPGIPSATEVVKEGIDLAEMNAKLLAKIEELTLYMIDFNRQIKAQDRKIIRQQQEIKALKKKGK